MKVPQRVLDRFMDRVQIGDNDECWPWMGVPSVRGAYGRVGWREDGTYYRFNAHRVAWVLANGSIPEGLTVDHICRVRVCCNPAHLRLLTRSENSSNNGWKLRTHCRHGHAFDTANTYINPKGHRNCRACKNAAGRRARRLAKAAY